MNARRWAGLGLLAVIVTLVAVRIAGRAVPGSSAVTHHAVALKSLEPHHAVTVDLYVPQAKRRGGPLVVLLQGNAPAEPDDRSIYGAEVGDAMQRNGIEAASIAFDAESASLRSSVPRLAAVIEELSRDSGGVVLVGRGLGAWAAAMLALDRRCFEGVGFDPKRILRVVGLRGTYDLDEAALEGHPYRDFFSSMADRGESSPTTFVRSDAPPFLLLNGGGDNGTWPRLARSFARSLQSAGGRAESYVVPGHDEHNITHWTGNGNELGELVMSFISSGLHPLPIDNTFGVRQRWGTRPPLDNDELRTDKSRITTFPVDAEFMSTLNVMFERFPYELNVLPGKTYEAVDLLSYLGSRSESDVGRGDYLVVTNIRGEQQYFSRTDLEKTKPVLVVGMDDETNLYRLFAYYRLKQAYSWKKGEERMPMMIRPLGAFLHFRTAPPPELRNRSYAPYGLTSKSFRWRVADPLGPVRDLTGPLGDAMMGDQGCLKCHSFRGAGARAHHNLALDATTYGAFALSLEEYPEEVLRRFLFEQDAVARSFDVAPLRVAPAAARSLFDMVKRERRP
jgi:hypothetical protein